MKLFHVITAASTAEIEVVKRLKPPLILISYFYFKNRLLKDFIDEIGYQPEILLDSGAYSAFTKSKNISPIDFMNYISNNKMYIKNYISLDVIQDSFLTLKFYDIMLMKGFSPIPVFHYGESEAFLQNYIDRGNDYIALGNTVPIKNKVIVMEWVQTLISKYPGIRFHLLGSSSKKIIQNTDLFSCDSSTWMMMAINGFPKHIMGKDRAAKIERAFYNMKEELNR